MTQETYRELLLAGLDRAAELRTRVAEDAAFGDRRLLLRAWQAARLARTHRDLLESRRFHDATQFFLTDLYGPRDLSRHVDEVRRLVPVMTSVLPDWGLATVAHAMELNVVSESLDGAMVEALGEKAADIDDALYAAAYRAADRAKDRERQIDLIALLGQALDKLAQTRFIGMTLHADAHARPARGPGRIAGFPGARLRSLRGDARRRGRVCLHHRRPRTGDLPGDLRRRRRGAAATAGVGFRNEKAPRRPAEFPACSEIAGNFSLFAKKRRRKASYLSMLHQRRC